MKNLARDYDVEMEDVKNKPKRKPRMRPDAPGDSSMDLIPPSMLPSKPAIPPGREMGGDIKKAKGGSVYARGAKVGSASKRADGCAERGLTKGKMV